MWNIAPFRSMKETLNFCNVEGENVFLTV